MTASGVSHGVRVVYLHIITDFVYFLDINLLA